MIYIDYINIYDIFLIIVIQLAASVRQTHSSTADELTILNKIKNTIFKNLLISVLLVLIY